MQNRITELMDPSDNAVRAADPADTVSPDQLDAILDDYNRGDLTLPDLAANHNIPITQLLDILDSPRISALLDRIANHAQLQAQRLAAAAQPLALDRLRQLVVASPADSRLLPPAVEARIRETARKAAAQLVRYAHKPSNNRARSASEVLPPSPPERGTPGAAGLGEGASPASLSPRAPRASGGVATSPCHGSVSRAELPITPTTPTPHNKAPPLSQGCS